MWEMKGDDLIVDKRHKVKFFATAAIISEGKYEQRIEEFFDTVDEAKAALAKQFAQLKAEDDEEPWQIADDGNAYFGEDKIFRVEVKDDKQFVGYAILYQHICDGIVCTDWLDFKRTDDEAREAIAEFVDDFNAEIHT